MLGNMSLQMLKVKQQIRTLSMKKVHIYARTNWWPFTMSRLPHLMLGE